jgi:hypothetical protein
MYLLIIVLYNENYVREILKKFLEIDVRGATLIRSKGMASLLSKEVPIFHFIKAHEATTE